MTCTVSTSMSQSEYGIHWCGELKRLVWSWGDDLGVSEYSVVKRTFVQYPIQSKSKSRSTLYDSLSCLLDCLFAYPVIILVISSNRASKSRAIAKRHRR